MNLFKTSLAAIVLLIGSFGNIALADGKKTVQPFYDLLSNPASEQHAAAFKEVITESWESIGNYSGKNKTEASFLGQIAGFGKLIPDLNWKVEQIIQEGNQVVVRSRATGIPVGPLFGVDGKGKGFDILTIDIHTIEDGKIASSYHVEDWAGALRQLSAE